MEAVSTETRAQDLLSEFDRLLKEYGWRKDGDSPFNHFCQGLSEEDGEALFSAIHDRAGAAA